MNANLAMYMQKSISHGEEDLWQMGAKIKELFENESGATRYVDLRKSYNGRTSTIPNGSICHMRRYYKFGRQNIRKNGTFGEKKTVHI